MKPDQEKAELELFRSGKLDLTDEVKEDASAVAPPKDQVNGAFPSAQIKI